MSRGKHIGMREGKIPLARTIHRWVDNNATI
jgi:hypothetical protein